jgi:O-antigen/teichoic acid export membrane protein
MELEKSRNARRNILWGMINKFITILLPFINRTIFLYILGVELLGLNSLFTSILQMLNLAEMGVGSALVYSMYKPIAKGDKAMICALLSLYRKVYTYIGLVILSLGLLIIPFLNDLVQGHSPNGVNMWFAYGIYLVNTVISYFCYSYKTALPYAFQRVDLISNISSLTQIMTSILQICMLYFIQDYYAYLIIMPITTFLNNLLTARVVNKNFPEYNCAGQVPNYLHQKIKRRVLGLFIGKVCGTTRNALDSICLSMFIGLSVTAIYNNYLYVVMAVSGLFGVVMKSIVAGVGNSMEIYNREKNYQDMRKMNFIYMLLSGWTAVIMLCLFQPFMLLWTGIELMFSFDIVILFVMYFYLLCMGDVRASYSDAAGLWWETRYRAVIESVVNVVLNLVLGRLFGVCGIIWATLISLFFINFCWGSQIVFQYYFKNGKIWKYFGDHLKYLCITIIVMVITYGICSLERGGAWFTFATRAITCFVLPLILYNVLWYKNVEYRHAMKWFFLRVNLNILIRVLRL